MLPQPQGQLQDQRLQTQGWGSDEKLRFHGQRLHAAAAAAGVAFAGQQLESQLWTAAGQPPETLLAAAGVGVAGVGDGGGSVPVDATQEHHTATSVRKAQFVMIYSFFDKCSSLLQQTFQGLFSTFLTAHNGNQKKIQGRGREADVGGGSVRRGLFTTHSLLCLGAKILLYTCDEQYCAYVIF